MANYDTISIKPSTKERFDKLLKPRESSDSLLKRLLDVYEHQEGYE